MTTLLPILALSLLYLGLPTASQQPNTHCTCRFGESFGDCQIKDHEKVWREHYNLEVGLYEDCLPQVEENKMKCFKWRLADNCGPNQAALKCNLRHLDEANLLISSNQDVTFVSLGFNNTKPGYKTRSLCVYNISLDCPSNRVELEPSLRTTSLSDAETCQDYLSFHVDSQRIPVMKLCGQDVADKTKYRDIHSNSFYGVLWSNSANQRGKFEITASCKDTPLQGSGDDDLMPTTTIF